MKRGNLVATKQDLYDAIDILSVKYFNGVDKNARIYAARHYWLKDKRRNVLAYPSFILIAAAESLVRGSPRIKAGSKYIQNAFYQECNNMVMDKVEELLQLPDSPFTEDALGIWAEIAKNAGLLLTVDKINERLAEYE